MSYHHVTIVGLCLFLCACGARPPKPSEAHIRTDEVTPHTGNIPELVRQTMALPPPKRSPKLETYSVVVTGVPAQEILFALARDARINLDIHSGIRGVVTLNAIDQTLPQILDRIAKQVDIRYEMDGMNLVVMPDVPFLRNYKINYVNMSRDTSSNVGIATQIATPGAAGGAGGTMGANDSGNVSVTSIKNVAKNNFWETLEKNIRDLLRETDKIFPAGATTAEAEAAEQEFAAERRNSVTDKDRYRDPQTGSPRDGDPDNKLVRTASSRTRNIPLFREAAAVIANPETGIIMVRATARQHERVQEFLDHVMVNARRQVLIEATIVEVALSQNYQQGIDWQYLSNNRVVVGQGATTQKFSPISGLLTAVTNSYPPTAVASSLFTAAFKEGGFVSAIRLLETFGTIKVVSSPKLSVLNNQTAVLKVVDNLVYFTIRATTSQVQTSSLTTFTSTPNTVSVGFVMSVTPQISDDGTVLLNLRPTISRTIGAGKQDPNPSLNGVTSIIPEIQTREMESLMRVNNGEIAVMGGLMQDEVNNSNNTIPGVGTLPFFGNLLAHRNETSRKTELVIFVRPVIINEPGLDGDYRHLRGMALKNNFFTRPAHPADVIGDR